MGSLGPGGLALVLRRGDRQTAQRKALRAPIGISSRVPPAELDDLVGDLLLPQLARSRNEVVEHFGDVWLGRCHDADAALALHASYAAPRVAVFFMTFNASQRLACVHSNGVLSFGTYSPRSMK